MSNAKDNGCAKPISIKQIDTFEVRLAISFRITATGAGCDYGAEIHTLAGKKLGVMNSATKEAVLLGYHPDTPLGHLAENIRKELNEALPRFMAEFSLEAERVTKEAKSDTLKSLAIRR